MDVVLPCLREIANLSLIDALMIGTLFLYDKSAWAARLSHFINVTTLHILDLYSCPSMLLASLSPQSPDLAEHQAHAGEKRTILPRLSHLLMELLDLRQVQRVYGDVRQGIGCEQFLQLLSGRRDAGHPIEHLSIKTLIVFNPPEAKTTLIPRLEALVLCLEIDEVLDRSPDARSGMSGCRTMLAIAYGRV